MSSIINLKHWSFQRRLCSSPCGNLHLNPMHPQLWVGRHEYGSWRITAVTTRQTLVEREASLAKLPWTVEVQEHHILHPSICSNVRLLAICSDICVCGRRQTTNKCIFKLKRLFPFLTLATARTIVYSATLAPRQTASLCDQYCDYAANGHEPQQHNLA